MAFPPRPSCSGSFLWQSPVVDASTSVAPSVYLQTHGTPVVQSTDPAGGFFGRAPIFANSSSFEPGHDIVPVSVQNSMSVFEFFGSQ